MIRLYYYYKCYYHAQTRPKEWLTDCLRKSNRTMTHALQHTSAPEARHARHVVISKYAYTYV